MKLTCKELGEANAYITDIAQKTVREELSNIVGTATESIIRLLSELKNDRLIELKGRKIKILDKPGLKFIAGL